MSTIVAVTLVGFLLALLNGANCAGNVIGLVLGFEKRGVKVAFLFNPLFMFIGALLMGSSVSYTFVKGILDYTTINSSELVVRTVLSIFFSTATWTLIALLRKVPVSVSQVAVGGMLGSALPLCGLSCINWLNVAFIVVSWFATPLISIAFSLALYKVHIHVRENYSDIYAVIETSLYFFIVLSIVQYLLYVKVFEKAQAIAISLAISLMASTLYTLYLYSRPEKNEDLYNYAYGIVAFTASFMVAFIYGAHDVASIAGPLSIAFSKTVQGFNSNVHAALPAALTISATGLSLGASLWSYRVAETVGAKITPLTVESSLLVQLSTFLTVTMLVVLGLPSSVTLAVIGSVAGAGCARGLEYVNWRTLFKIITMWVLGVPVTIFLSAISFTILKISS